MEYSKIISVTGLSGLFELLTSKTDGAIVRSLEDKSTKFVSSRVHNFSHLESIEVYTVRDNVNLVEIFHAMEQSQDPLPDEKDNNAIKKYFQKVFPDLDFDRVYASDMKKMVKWFAELKANQVTIELPPPEEVEEQEPARKEAIAEPIVTGKPAKNPKKIAEPKKPIKEEKAEKKEKKAEKKKAEKKEEKKVSKPAAKKTTKETPKKEAGKTAKKSAKAKSDKPAAKKKTGK
jgi:outer membrane biosynthesis protein TonB